jgi:serine/threonine-protein kinase
MTADTHISSDDWRRIERIYREALDRDGAERVAYLDDACRGDDALRCELDVLLQDDGAADRTITDAVGQVLGQLIAAQRTASLTGETIGTFRVLERLGAGGMGEVYRAHDTRLNRHVAIKVLPPMFLDDGERRARFEREAQTLASLHHPYIGAVYGLEETEGIPALVLELVEGPTLAERLRSGALPIGEALNIARQIAEAVEAAHDNGVVHRDLKPANIKLVPDGTIKVIDFGLAVTARDGVAGGNQDAHHEPLTDDAAIVGTTNYLSPEQARGRTVDRRTDIWSFGCIVYEMLSGRRAFAAESWSDTVAAIMKGEPAWDALPTETPPGIRRLIARCLEKDARRRLRDIGDARLDLEEALAGSGPTSSPEPSRQPTSRVRIRPAVGVGIAAVAFASGVAAMALWPRTADAPVVQFAIHTADTEQLGDSPALAISPDGNLVPFVSVSNGIPRLNLRALDTTETRIVSGSEGAQQPFFSPDGQWVGFFADQTLRKAPVIGGAAVIVCGVNNPRGGSWAEDNTIIFGSSNTGLLRVSAAGGTPAPLTPLKSPEGSHRYPHVLPDGRAVVFAAGPSIASSSWPAHIEVLSLISDERRTLAQRGTYPKFVQGRLLYVNGGVLHAVVFDAKRLQTTGAAVALSEHLSQRAGLNAGSVDFDVSRTGTAVYIESEPSTTSFVWVDRTGTVTRLPLPPAPYGWFALSPDNTRLAYTLSNPEPDVWVHDFVGGTATRLTSGGTSQWPIWSRDGRRITFASTRTGAAMLFWKPADGSGPEEQLTRTDFAHAPRAWAPDGETLLFDEVTGTSTVGPWLLRASDRRPVPLKRDTRSEAQGAISPDGRWIAYYSIDSGRREVYVRAFPGGGPAWRVSTDGGEAPLWNPKGSEGGELFYRHGSDVMAVDVRMAVSSARDGRAFAAGTPRRLVGGDFLQGPWPLHYDVAADGRRFLMLKREVRKQSSPTTVVTNWVQRLPTLP